jgi:cysteine desulfurase / selenocysteine lyase
MPLSTEELAREFPLEPDLLYLNHAGVAPWPRCAVEAVERFARENLHRAARRYPEWLLLEQQLRRQLATLIGAPGPDSIALLKNTSEGLSFVASGLEWKPGDNIVIPAEEFPSNRIVWEALQRRGVVLRRVPVLGVADPESALMAACDTSTRLLSVSACQYINGLCLSLDVLGEYCRRHSVFFVVDAIQRVGALEVDVAAIGCDVAVADAHKWMLGPEGIALFYVRPAAMDRLRVSEFGWHMTADPGNYDRDDWELAPDARRYECGSPNFLGIHALSASLGLMERHGLAQVHEDLRKKIRYLHELVTSIPGITDLTPAQAARRSGMVTIRIPDVNPGVLGERLKARGLCVALRGGGVRFSPHFYTPDDVLLRAAETLAEEIRAARLLRA